MVKRKRSKISMPMSGAGLVRYMDEEGRGMKFKPEHILFAALGVILVELLFKMGVI
ncbi:MAG: preprotein translocase subunit Sec61beta [Candidatus Hydrothermarchaeaceae archaeon]